jgi:hypothetical protein
MPDRQTYRGDTTVIELQVLVNVLTGALVSIGPLDQFPPGYAPANITGWRVEYTAKYYVQDPDNQAVWQGDNETLGGIVLTEALIGKFTITQPGSTTAQFPDGPVALVTDVKAKNVASTPVTTTVDSGTLTVLPSVTRASL